MRAYWRGLISGWRKDSSVLNRRRVAPQVAGLEERKLLYVTPTAVAVPTILVPDGRTMQVNVSGTVNSVVDLGATASPQTQQLLANVPVPSATFQVTDLYRRDEPRARLDLIPIASSNFEQVVATDGVNAMHTFSNSTYYYSVDIPLTAERTSGQSVGRRYYILVSAGDQDNGNGVTVPVLVPQNAAEASQALIAQKIRPVRDAQYRQDVIDYRAARARRRGA